MEKGAKKGAGLAAQAPVKLLFVASEATPFISTGGMGQVVGALPGALKNVDDSMDVRVVMPLYEAVQQRFGAMLEFVGSTQVRLAWRNQYCGVLEARLDGITYYFIDNQYYFARKNCYGYYDDGERFAYFCKGVFAMMEMTGFTPDIIHAHDWQSALVPVYMKTRFAGQYDGVKTVFTIHNLEYQGKCPLAALGDVCDLECSETHLVEYDGQINLMKGALVCSDALTTVSPSYVEEIQLSGFGLEHMIREYNGKLHGILNGIDVKLYDPVGDTSLSKNYDADSIENKVTNKMELQTLFGLPRVPRKMLICMVSRLAEHKGIDLLAMIMEDLLRLDVQFLLLGTGEHKYELFFEEMAVQHPSQVGVNIAYNPAIASKIYAGADVMLMPSRSEPCGLAQMIACRYGTIPIVRATGGLKDSIRDCRGGEGNGFAFTEYSAAALLDTIRQAHDLYTYREQDWGNLMRAAMRCDFSWDKSAAQYMAIYRGLHP